MGNAVAVERGNDPHREWIIDLLVPYAITFLEKEGGTPEQFGAHLVAAERVAAAAQEMTGLNARGVDAAKLNGELDQAAVEAQLYLVVKTWYEKDAFQPGHPPYEEYVRQKLGLSDEEVKLIRPVIDKAFTRCVGVR